MKYIRTKDGICEVTKEDEHILHYHNSQVDGVLWKADWDGKYKSADTIEELCDEFVIVGISGIPYGTHGLLGECEKREKNFLKQLIKTQEYEIYGAIWTDKGLIYVAKMNEKGELELL